MIKLIKMYKSFFKRLIDLLTSSIALLILSPIFVMITLVLSIKIKGNPFFMQKRPGKSEKIFSIIKFKTMNDEKDDKGELLEDQLRLTKFGAFLRKTSLDEIPQLINVFLGQMSLIGPRPLLIRYLPFYTIEERLRHTVRPGISGLAQISGRNMLDWDDRLEKDVEYVKDLSFLLDVKIILKTIGKVLKSEDVILAPGSHATDLDEVRKRVFNR